MPLLLILAPLLAQVGPSVSPGAGRALPTAPLEIPRKAKAVVAPPASPAIRSPLERCHAEAESKPDDALVYAEEWAGRADAAALADALHCKAMALSELGRWGLAETAFLAARDALLGSQLTRRAQLQASAGIAADEGGARERGLGLLDAAHADARAAGDRALAGKIALDRVNPLYLLGRKAEAAAALAEAREALSGNADVWLISARFSRRESKLDQAQQQIERAAALRPTDPAIGLEAGLIAVLGGREMAARKSWEAVLRLAPGSAEALAAQSYLDQLGQEPPSPGR